MRVAIRRRTWDDLSMRITLNLDNDILQLAKQYASQRDISLGKALPELTRKGLNAQRPTRHVNGLLVFHLKKDSPKVTSERVRKLL
jgi:hypothetical protein